MEEAQGGCRALRSELMALEKRIARADAILAAYVPVQYRKQRLGLPSGATMAMKDQRLFEDTS